MRVSGGATIIGKDLANETIVTPVKEAVKQNAIGVGVSVFVGSDYETQTVTNLANVVSEAHDYGLPVLGITAVAKNYKNVKLAFSHSLPAYALKWVLTLLKRTTAKDSKNNEHMPCPSCHRGWPKTRFN